MSIRVLGTRRFILNMHTRMPFRYGIATLTALPHLFLQADVEIDGKVYTGLTAEHLPPKWFTKDPDTGAREDIDRILKVIETACDIAAAVAPTRTVFDFWRRAYEAQSAWAGGWAIPPLLAHFGTSLVERAVLDAACRAWGVNFAAAVRENWIGMRLGAIHPELEGAEPRDLLPAEPLRSVNARHTVGLSDPLADADVAAAERIDDGLPQSLEACIRAYGLTHFKIKLWGDAGRDLERVRRVADVIQRETRAAGAGYGFTLDGNENFKEVEPFRKFWVDLTTDASLAVFLNRLIFVEQPLHRAVAMNEQAAGLARWDDRPRIIIDESDGEIDTARRALGIGYAGTSHKNCKGVLKSIANACFMEHRRRTTAAGAGAGGTYILSGEDLSNVGPVALPQDLCVAAILGITHVERNGHHYFRGLSMFPPDVQAAALRAQPGLYRRHERGFVTPAIVGGRMNVGDVIGHGTGANVPFDPARFTPVERWTFDSLEGGGDAERGKRC